MILWGPLGAVLGLSIVNRCSATATPCLHPITLHPPAYTSHRELKFASFRP